MRPQQWSTTNLGWLIGFICLFTVSCQGDEHTEDDYYDLIPNPYRRSVYFSPIPYFTARSGGGGEWWNSFKRAPGSEFLGKRAPGSEFLGKRAPGSEFLGKRAPGSEFLGKRAPGSEFLGKRAPGSEFLGKRNDRFNSNNNNNAWWWENTPGVKRAPGSEFLGKRAPGSEFLGKRAPGSEFLGKRAPGSEFLGKRVPGSEFLGKRAPGSEFLGKRGHQLDYAHNVMQEANHPKGATTPISGSGSESADNRKSAIRYFRSDRIFRDMIPYISTTLPRNFAFAPQNTIPYDD